MRRAQVPDDAFGGGRNEVITQPVAARPARDFFASLQNSRAGHAHIITKQFVLRT